jgi:hypothetical protein
MAKFFSTKIHNSIHIYIKNFRIYVSRATEPNKQTLGQKSTATRSVAEKYAFYVRIVKNNLHINPRGV